MHCSANYQLKSNKYRNILVKSSSSRVELFCLIYFKSHLHLINIWTNFEHRQSILTNRFQHLPRWEHLLRISRNITLLYGIRDDINLVKNHTIVTNPGHIIPSNIVLMLLIYVKTINDAHRLLGRDSFLGSVLLCYAAISVFGRCAYIIR